MTALLRGGSRLAGPLLSSRPRRRFRDLSAEAQTRVLRFWLGWQTNETADALAMFERRPDTYWAVSDRLLDYILGVGA